MKDEIPRDGGTSQRVSNRSPEEQKRLDEWRKKIGQSLVDNLNRAVLAQPEKDLQSIAEGSSKQQSGTDEGSLEIDKP
jgi:hypothetical protein